MIAVVYSVHTYVVHTYDSFAYFKMLSGFLVLCLAARAAGGDLTGGEGLYVSTYARYVL